MPSLSLPATAPQAQRTSPRPASRGACQDAAMSKWVKRDRRYRKGYRLTSHAWRMMLGWGAFIVIWLLLGSLYGWPGLLGLLTVIAYGGFSAVRGASRRAVTRATPPVTYLPPPAAPLGQRNTRSIPQAVKIAVVTRDGARRR